MTRGPDFLTVCPNSDGRPGGPLRFDSDERTVATVDDPVTNGIGSAVAVRRLAFHQNSGVVLARRSDRANNPEVTCGYSLDRA